MTPIPIQYSPDPIRSYGVDCANLVSAQQKKGASRRLTVGGPRKVRTMKKYLLPVAIVCSFASSVLAQSTPTPTPTATPLPVLYELYGTAPTGVPLNWKAVPPDPVLYTYPRPAVIVVHEGGYKNNDPGNMDAAQDLARAGYLALAIEFRLAPPHEPMNSPRHCCPGQNDVGDDGYYPEQVNDLQMAIRAARVDPRCNGKVGSVGGSSGGSLPIYWAGTGTPGDDKLDVAVSLSPATDFHDPASLADTRRPNFAASVYNFVNSTDASNGGPLDLASPYRFVTSSMCPYYIIASDQDEGVPLQQFPDMIAALDAAGVTNYQSLLRPDSRLHGFAYWPEVKDGVIAFFAAGFAAGDPTITTQPANKTVAVGRTAKFRVTASGTAPLSYQWRKNGSNITGATQRFYETPPTTLADNGSLFSVVVSNTNGSVTSNNATLRVH